MVIILIIIFIDNRKFITGCPNKFRKYILQVITHHYMWGKKCIFLHAIDSLKIKSISFKNWILEFALVIFVMITKNEDYTIKPFYSKQ